MHRTYSQASLASHPIFQRALSPYDHKPIAKTQSNAAIILVVGVMDIEAPAPVKGTGAEVDGEKALLDGMKGLVVFAEIFEVGVVNVDGVGTGATTTGLVGVVVDVMIGVVTGLVVLIGLTGAAGVVGVVTAVLAVGVVLVRMFFGASVTVYEFVEVEES